LLPESTFESSSDIIDFGVSIVSMRFSCRRHNALMQLHNWFARALFGRQFNQCLSHFVGNVLNHVDFAARPGTPVIALLQNDAAVNALRTAQGHP
jgi:hypothetical protein